MSAGARITTEEWSSGTVQTVRKSLGKSEAEIAAKAGIDVQTYRDFEAGKINDGATGFKIIEALRTLGGKYPIAGK